MDWNSRTILQLCLALLSLSCVCFCVQDLPSSSSSSSSSSSFSSSFSPSRFSERVAIEDGLALPARSPPARWEDAGAAPLDLPLPLTVALRLRNSPLLQKWFTAVSDPSSAEYGKHWSQEKVAELVAPRQEDVQRVLGWLGHYGIRNFSLSSSRDFVKVKCSVAQAQELLQAKFHLFVDSVTGVEIARAKGGYSLPAEVASLIDFVGEVVRFPQMKSRGLVRGQDGSKLMRLHTERASGPSPSSSSSSSFPLISTKWTAGDAPLPNGGVQLVRVYPGDGQLGVFFVPICPGGLPLTNQTGGGACAVVDGQVDVAAAQWAGGSGWTGGVASVGLASPLCLPCSGWAQSAPQGQGKICQSWGQQQKFPQPSLAVFCSLPPQTFLGVPNYQNTSLTFSLQFEGSDPVIDVYGSIYTGAFYTPKGLAEFYGMDQMGPSNNSQNSQSVAEFLGQYYSPADLAKFFAGTATYSGPVSLVGPNDPSNPGAEASLDIQYLMGLAQNITTTFWSEGGLYEGQEPFLQWITDVLNDPSPPWVHSISYGDDERTLSVSYMTRCDQEFQKAGLRGLSLLFSSGDSGVNPGGGAETIDGQAACLALRHFVPSFPASSPSVTAVGGTQLTTQTEGVCGQLDVYGEWLGCQSNSIGEIGSSIQTGSRITSGGGFSDVFAQPAYQQQWVGRYVQQVLKKSDVPPSYFNASGRAYPDVSANARNFLVVLNGSWVSVDGTSASAPTVASMVALWNEVRLNRHQPPLGFINPLLYSAASTDYTRNFRDVSLGNNRCGENLATCCPYGYPASLGWDAVTGLGSPQFGGVNAYSSIVLG